MCTKYITSNDDSAINVTTSQRWSPVLGLTTTKKLEKIEKFPIGEDPKLDTISLELSIAGTSGAEEKTADILWNAM